jgi:hypothetical protein
VKSQVKRYDEVMEPYTRVLCDNHRALGLDVLAVKLDTLRVDLAVELENRDKPLAPADERPAPAG